MKWFKHETDAHMNLKLQAVIEKFGVAAYGYYWACVELVANQGTNFCLGREKQWEKHLEKCLNVQISIQKEYLVFFAKQKLIDSKSLRKGQLYMPKLEDRQDEYTEKKKRKVSGQSPDSVPLEEIRTEQKREEEKRREIAFESFWKEYPNKEAKKKSLEIWKRKKLDVHLPEIILFIAKAKETDRWKRGFIKQPPTFLNNESWNDDFAAYNEKGSKPNNSLNQGSEYRNNAIEKAKASTIKVTT